MDEFHTIRVRSVAAVFQQLRVVRSGFFRLVRQLGRSTSASQAVEPVGIGLHGLLIFSQRFLWATHFQQHVGEHFACGQFDFAFAFGILSIRDRAQQLQGVVVSSLRKCQPGMRFIVVGAHAIGAIRMLAFSCGVEHGIELIHRILGRGRIA